MARARENPDILATIASQFSHLTCIGFAAETEHVIPNAQAKFMGVLFMGGGLFLGRAVGQFLFCTPELQRLRKSHELDNQSKTYLQIDRA